MSAKNLKLPKSDKRKLFFDRSRNKYIEFDLEKMQTCLEIYESLHEEIDKNIFEIHKNTIKKIDFSFIMIKSSSKFDNSLIEIKLDLEAQLSDLMINKQNYLCYLPVNKFNINKKRKVRNNLEEEIHIDRFKDVERNASKDHDLEKYLSNEGIYYFDKEKVQFIYGKGSIDENKFIINYKKNNIEILINDIKKDAYFENKVPPSLQNFSIKYPNFIFQIQQNNITHFLGVYKEKSYLIWKNAIYSAKIKNNNNSIDSNFNSDTTNHNYILFVRKQSIPNKCFIINQILENPLKRQIFFDEYKDKKISDIANAIFSYKINIKNNKYIEAWVCLKQISFYVDFNNIEDDTQKKREKEKYSKIFTQEIIDKYNNVLQQVNESLKKIKNYEKEINNILKNIFEFNLFDNLYYNIFELYIWPYFQDIKKEITIDYKYNKKPNIIQRLHLLVSRYTINYYDMKNIDNYNCLCISNDDYNEIEVEQNDEINDIINGNSIISNNIKINESENSNLEKNKTDKNNNESNSEKEKINEVKNENVNSSE